MAIFGFKKKKEEKISTVPEQAPKFLKVAYDDKHKPIGAKAVEGPEVEEFCVFSKKEKDLIFQWFDYFSRHIELLREELQHIEPRVPKELIEQLNKLESEIYQLVQTSSPAELNERLQYLQTVVENLRVNDVATKNDLEIVKQELLKTIKDATISKEELVNYILTKLPAEKPKKPVIKLSEEKEKMIKSLTRVVNTALRLRSEERVLIIADRKMIALGRMLYRIAREINPKTIMMIVAVGSRDGEEPDDAVADAMRGSDLIVIVTYKSMSHTDAVRYALDKGARVASLPNISKFSLLRGGLTADFDQVKQNTAAMYAAVNNSREVMLTADNGTELKFSVLGRKWEEDDSLIRDQGKLGNLPGGEVSVAPIEDSVNGRIMFDHFALAKGKLELVIKDGMVVKLKGSAKKLRRIFKQLGVDARAVGEFGIGCNPNAKIIGNTLEDEKVFGTVHVALGNNIFYGGKNSVAFHCDGIIENPNVKVDGRFVIKSGRWMI